MFTNLNTVKEFTLAVIIPLILFYGIEFMFSSPSVETWSVDRKYVNADSTYNYVLHDHKGDLQLLTDSNYDLEPSKPVIRACSETYLVSFHYNCIFFTSP